MTDVERSVTMLRSHSEDLVCPKHPKYRAVHPPRTLQNCRCNEIWMEKRIHDMLREIQS